MGTIARPLDLAGAMRAAVLLAIALAAGCGGDDDQAPADAATDAPPVPDAAAPDSAAPSCLAEHAAGERYPVGDGCNFCACQADGSTSCTARTCVEAPFGCAYDGVDRGYGERFPSTDGCNECTCAPSGLACTRRVCAGALEEGAILLETLDQSCGDDPTFTAQAVLDGLPHADVSAPFRYDRARELFPETLPDTTVRVRVVYGGGIAVCRIPSPDQPAIDMQIVVEWITADGAFDEGLAGYLRRNNFGFVDAWYVAASAPLGGLSGSYVPSCAIDPGDYAFNAQIDADGQTAGSITRICETDIALEVGRFEVTP